MPNIYVYKIIYIFIQISNISASRYILFPYFIELHVVKAKKYR